MKNCLCVLCDVCVHGAVAERRRDHLEHLVRRLVGERVGRAGLAEEEILRRLQDASAHLPYEQLGISTQCGFASVIAGNEIDEDAQGWKLDLVARVADRVWPR